MPDPGLQIYMTAFLIVASALLLCWKPLRLFALLEKEKERLPLEQYSRLKRINSVFWIILALFALMIGVYAAIPRAYYIFIPLNSLDHPVINFIGLLVLKIAIIWIVIAQLHIDKELYKYFRKIDSLPVMELIHFSERMLLSGMLVLFLGIVVTITNVIGLILLFAGILTFKVRLKEKKSFN